MEPVKCYKVLADSNLNSWNHDRIGVWSVKYKLGVKNNAKPEAQALGYHLLAFETLESVKFLFGFLEPKFAQVWECVGIPVELKPPHTLDCYCFKFDDSEHLWGIYGWPTGTIMIRDLELIRRVMPEEWSRIPSGFERI